MNRISTSPEYISKQPRQKKSPALSAPFHQINLASDVETTKTRSRLYTSIHTMEKKNDTKVLYSKRRISTLEVPKPTSNSTLNLRCHMVKLVRFFSIKTKLILIRIIKIIRSFYRLISYLLINKL